MESIVIEVTEVEHVIGIIAASIGLNTIDSIFSNGKITSEGRMVAISNTHISGAGFRFAIRIFCHTLPI